jgi:hypothetical protein
MYISPPEPDASNNIPLLPPPSPDVLITVEYGLPPASIDNFWYPASPGLFTTKMSIFPDASGSGFFKFSTCKVVTFDVPVAFIV